MLGQCKSSKLVSGQVGQLEGPPTSKYNKSSQDATAPAGGQIFSVHKQIHVAVAFNDDVRSGQPRAACGHTLNSAGTTDTLVTDSSWCVYTGLPAGYEQPSFEDTTWAVAKNIGTYRFFDPGDAVVTLSCPPCPPAIALYYAGWIWTDVVPSSGKVPAGSILITADDDYTLYINGVPIGSGSNWQVAQHYTVNFGAGTTEVVFAVLATNVAPSAATTAGGVLLGVGRIAEVDPSSFKIFMSFFTILRSLWVFERVVQNARNRGITTPGNGGASGFAALGVMVSEAAELAPERAADCQPAYDSGIKPARRKALGIPDMAAGVLDPAAGIDVGEVLAVDTVLLGLAAAAMLKFPLVANIWLMSVMFQTAGCIGRFKERYMIPLACTFASPEARARARAYRRRRGDEQHAHPSNQKTK
ncbi:hypothetical protein B0H13DRAFT_2380635 [Mycena leptocephala]|nr:hypothetical protein B0H13DRAFT_2380635 [Mycena leptocephala]